MRKAFDTHRPAAMTKLHRMISRFPCADAEKHLLTWRVIAVMYEHASVMKIRITSGETEADSDDYPIDNTTACVRGRSCQPSSSISSSTT